MRILLVVNPASGSGVDPEALAATLRDLGPEVITVPIDEIDAPGNAATAGIDRVVVAGGDGSLGPAAALAHRLGADLAVVPTGTANDLARSLGLPQDDRNAALALAAHGTRTRRIDIALAGSTPFLNAAACGLSVHATRRAEPLKGPLGPLAYLAGALHAAVRATPCRVRVTVDDRDLHDGEAWQVTGAFGGGSELQDATDGALDVAVLTGGPRLQLARRAYGMRHGGLADQAGVLTARGQTVSVAGPEAFNVDGDVREVPGGRFTLGPSVRVVVP